jgi:hypothetical protein
VFHVGADETDVHAINVIDDEHDDEQRQDVAFDFGDGGLQRLIGVVVHPGDGCIHCVFSHSLFLCGVKLSAALLIDIIQLGFFIVQPHWSNKTVMFLRVFILLSVLVGVFFDAKWAFC